VRRSLRVLSGRRLAHPAAGRHGRPGVISAAANLIPKEMAQLADPALAGKWEEARPPTGCCCCCAHASRDESDL
jgi:dihydrodipicolinate synthase/N-acetylneuraminate lyase